jgi:glycosyltransferase involved in cell wall biosynthesis
LLTTDEWEASDFGYVGLELLGYLDGAAPVTGRRRTRRPELPWANRLGQAVRSDGTLDVRVPQGQIDAPQAELTTAPFTVSGWALAPTSHVATVEMFVDGREVGRARICLERPDVARNTSHPDAPICGFEYLVGSGDLPAGATQITIKAIARDLEGASFSVGEALFSLAEPPDRPDSERGERLRAEARRQVQVARSTSSTTNVLVVTHRLDRGGAQLWLHEVIERLTRRAGVAVTVVAAADGPLRQELEALGVEVHLTGDHPVDGIDEYEGRVRELAAWAAPRRFDVSVVNALRSFPALEVADVLGIPSVVAIHESYDLETWWAIGYAANGVHPYVKERAEQALTGATVAVFEAEATRRLYERYAAHARLITLPYGIELGRIEPIRRACDPSEARARLGLPDAATVILCLGVIEPRKAQTCLAQAFGAVADQHPDAVLALVGESAMPHLAAHNHALRDQLGRAGLAARAMVIPLADAPYEWYSVADLFVCPSDVESLPRVVLEAMAFEVPVLASRIFGLPELIEHERNGWLCEPRDVGDLADALDGALRTAPARRAEIGRAGWRAVHARHDAAAYVERFATLLEGLASDPNADPRTLLGLAGDRPAVASSDAEHQ